MKEVLLEKLDNIEEKVSQIDKNLVRNTKDLEHHIENSEKELENLKSKVSKIEVDIEPFKKHMLVMSAFLKIITIIGGVAAAILGIIELVIKIKG